MSNNKERTPLAVLRRIIGPDYGQLDRLAKRCGMSVSSIQKLTCGQRIMTENAARRISESTGVNYAMLMGSVDDVLPLLTRGGRLFTKERFMDHIAHFPATGTAGGPGGGGCPQPSCGNCEELTARVALLEEERKILVRERDKARDALQRLADCDWVITPHDRMDAVREIAREALAKMEAAQ